ncbi:methionine--tRNA ligase [Patescibacteria group bacterium]|nr:methionine--tRNA ligase [Patescibacteria group bacterium]
MSNKFYITTTLPYVNAEPHIGFALEIVQADAIARYHRQKGDEVFFNTGTDEHGLKIYRAAIEQKKDPQEYCDEYAAKFDDLKKALNLSYDNFIRTTDKHHIKAAQEFWKRCFDKGDIYKKNYKIKYCVGCELEKTESELKNNKCPIHPNLDLEIIEEENYFFKYSNYKDKLLELYKNNSDFVIPNFRLTEIKKFTERGLEDFSISRLKEKMPWGVPVPNDDKHVMYVWFDALINYISCLGWPNDLEKFNQYWPGVQVAGKDNLRQQSSMWQAMLLSAGLETSKQILIHGFINSGGQKMSKSLGNVIDPFELVKKYGTDALRYYLLAEITPFEDGNFTIQKFEQKYNADLANGLGNLVARVSNLLEKNKIEINLCHPESRRIAGRWDPVFKKTFNIKMQEYKFNEALEILWKKLRKCDEIITKKQPWKLENKLEIKNILEPIAQLILNVAELLLPFMPDIAERLIAQFTEKQIKKSEILFPRI